jgi:hypothetical protein
VTSKVEKSNEVEAPLQRAYNQWTQFEQFPQFMAGVEQVKQLSDTTLHWIAKIAGVKCEWDAAILEQVPDRKVAWATSTGTTNTGSVYCESLGTNRTGREASTDHCHKNGETRAAASPTKRTRTAPGHDPAPDQGRSVSEARSSPTRKSQTADRCAALPPDGVLLAGLSLLAETAAALDNAEHASALHALLEPFRGEISEFGVGGWCGAVDHVLAGAATTLCSVRAGSVTQLSTRVRIR